MIRQVSFAAALVVTAQTPAFAKTADEAVMDCMFSVKGTQYVSVSVSSKNGKSSIRYKKTKQARKDKVSKADLEKIEANMSACISRETGNG